MKGRPRTQDCDEQQIVLERGRQIQVTLLMRVHQLSSRKPLVRHTRHENRLILRRNDVRFTYFPRLT